MICTELYIDQYKWLVHCFFAVDRYYIGSILSVLDSLDCSDDVYDRAYENLHSCQLDTGLTFSNGKLRESLMVIGLASSAAEYDNSIAHEIRHLVDGIANEVGLTSGGEDVAYLTGEIRNALHDVTSSLTCECRCCKENVHRLKSIYNVKRYRRVD